MSEQKPIFTVERIYLKDMSLEIPNAPEIFTAKESPKVDIQMRNDVRGLDDAMFEVVLTVTVTAPISKTRFNNNSTYLIVSLKIDGVEQYTSSPYGLMPGYYLEKELAPGSHSYDALYGMWNGYGGRETLYHFYGTYTQRSGVTENVNFTSPTIAQLMTKFSNSGLWEGWEIGTFNRLGIRFYSNGTWVAYKNNVQYANGNVTFVSRDATNWAVSFRIGTSNAVFYEWFDYFMAPTEAPVQYFYEGP